VTTVDQGHKTTSRADTGYGSYRESRAHKSHIKITLRNMYSKPHKYTLEWRFYAKNLESGKTHVHDSGTNSVPLKAGETKTMELQAAELASENRSYSYSYARYVSGEKQAGYLVLVKDGNRILAVESDNVDLKRSYMDAINAARLQPKPVRPRPAQPKPAPPKLR
jgi:hypothetical protein